MNDERGLATPERMLRLLRHLGITRAHFGQCLAEAAAHPRSSPHSR